jgi:hypothetical protein
VRCISITQLPYLSHLVHLKDLQARIIRVVPRLLLLNCQIGRVICLLLKNHITSLGCGHGSALDGHRVAVTGAEMIGAGIESADGTVMLLVDAASDAPLSCGGGNMANMNAEPDSCCRGPFFLSDVEPA